MITIFSAAALFTQTTLAQVTTNSGSGLSPTYPSLATAIAALNSATITDPVTITLTGNETAPSSGYLITKAGTKTNPIIIEGNTGIVTAFSPQPAGSRLDAIFRILGGDYITIRNFTMQENAGNMVTAVGNNTMTEFGVAVFYGSTSNGAQNNTIQNNTITLRSTYQNSIGIYSTTQHSYNNYSTVAPAVSNGGLNSGMKIYGNNISNVAFGIQYISTPNTPSIIDSGVEIGGNSSLTGNMVTFESTLYSDAGWASFNNYPTGIKYMNGVNINIQYNSVTSTNILTSVTGIRIDNSTSPYGVYYTNMISNNVINIITYATGTPYSSCINFGVGSPEGSTACNNNTMSITQSVNTSVSGRVQGIINSLNGISSEANGNLITLSQATSAGSNSSWVCAINNGPTTPPAANSIQKIQDNIITIKQNSTGGTYTADVVYLGAHWAGSGNIGTGIISNNQLLTTGSTIRTSTYVYGIHHDYTFSNMLTIDGNTINWDLTGPCNTYVTYATSSSGSSSQINVTNNNITFTGPIAGGSTHTMFFEQDGIGATQTYKNISNNTIFVNTPNIYSRVTLFSSAKAYGTFSNNNCNVTCASYITGSYLYDPSGPWTLDHNTYSFTSTGVSAMSNAILLSAGSGHVVSNNTITNINFSAGGSSGPYMSAINIESTDATSMNYIFGNKIYGMSTGAGSGSAQVTGIVVSGGMNSIYKNKIYNLTSSCTGTGTFVAGIRVLGGAQNNVYNNLIGLTNALTGVNSPDAVRGIDISSTTLNSLNKVYYNTIFLNLSSTGTNFGTTGIEHTVSATPTTSTLDMRNNIIVNTSTAKGTGLSAAFRRSGTALANYASTSDHNLFYAGTPSATNLVFYDGTNSDQTLLNYQMRVSPADAFSATENPLWLSTSGSDAGFLHIDPSVLTAIESGGTNIAGYPDDFDGDVRQGNPGYTGTGTAPDIGADEFEGQPLPWCAGQPAASTISGPAVVCAYSGTTLSLSQAYAGRGITYQWGYSTTAGGPYSNLGTFSTQATGNLSVPTYYICTITCSSSNLSFTTAEKSVLINELPYVAVTPASASYCIPGPAITLTASGASTYSWSPSSGLDVTSGAVVHASPAINTVYTVTGTGSNGCTYSASAAVTVGAAVTMYSVTAAPSIVCSNGSTTLQAYATLPYSSYCTASASNTSYEKIANVTLNSIYNPSSSTAGYENFTSVSTILDAGISYWMTVSVSLAYANDDRVLVWIDMNQDGVFTDPDERVYSAAVSSFCPSCSGTTTAMLSGTVIVPFTALNGNTRMRVRLYDNGYGPNATPCGISTYGQVEDYTVSIQGGSDPFTYTWSEIPMSGTLTGTTANPTTATGITVPQTYTVIATSYAGCTATGSVLVPIATPVTGVSITSSPACDGVDFMVTANTSGGGVSLHYAWSDGAGGVYPDARNVTANLAGGFHDFSVTVTDECGSACTMSQGITVSASPGGIASGPSTGYTYDNLSYTVAGFVSGATFQWQISTSGCLSGYSDIVGATTEMVILPMIVARIYFVRCLVTGPNGCTAATNSVTTLISVGGDNVCSSLPLSIGLNGPYTNYGATTEAGEPVPPGTGCTTQTGWCPGQTMSNTIWFHFVAPPSGRISIGNNPLLNQWNNQFALYWAETCQDLFGGGATLIAANDDSTVSTSPYKAWIAPVCLIPGATYFLQVDGNGTTTKTGWGIRLKEEPNAPPVISGCPGNMIVPVNASNCSAFVTWTLPVVSDPDNCLSPVNFTSNYNPGSNFPMGSTTVTYTACDGINPPQTCSFTITVVNDNRVNISGSRSICVRGSTTLDAGTGYSNYIWSTGATTQTITVNTASTYTVTATDIFGCTSSSSATTAIVPLPICFVVTGGGSYCAGGTGVPVGLSGSQTGVNYTLWSYSGEIAGPVPGTGGPLSFGLQTLPGYIMARAENIATGCTNWMYNFIVISITQPVPVSVSINASANPSVAGEDVTFTATAVNGGDTPSFQWQVNGFNAGINSSAYTCQPVNGDRVTCVVTSSKNCVLGNPAASDTLFMIVNGISPHITIIGTIAGGQSRCFNAAEIIAVGGGGTRFMVENEGSAVMIAGQSIHFLPTSLVKSGGYLWGHIAPTGPFCQPPAMPAVAADQEEPINAMTGSFFKVYPNPTSGKFNIEFAGEAIDAPVVVKIYNMTGSIIGEKVIRSGKIHEFSLINQSPGIYLIRVAQGKETGIGKIIRQ